MSGLFLSALLVALVPFGAQAAQPCPPRIDPFRELLVLDPEVLDGDDMAWDLAQVLDRLSGPQDSSQLLRSWISAWSGPSGAGPVRLLEVWPKDAFGHPSVPNAPWKISAVVFRPDLGELRLTYGAQDPLSLRALPASAIFEFALPLGENWAARFHALGEVTGTALRERLAAIVRKVATRSGFLRLRTNDFVSSARWEMRELALDAGGRFRINPLEQTPHDGLGRTASARGALASWIRAHQSVVSAGNHRLPESWRAHYSTVDDETFSWLRAEGLDEKTRASFSRRTCNGCHTGDTSARFFHVFPRERGGRSELSAFMDRELETRARILTRQLCAR